jgi:hypothetical protein
MGHDPVTRGGSRILRHRQRGSGFTPAGGDEGAITAITTHIETHLGPVDWVFHEVVSDLVHIDVHLVKPTPERPHWTLVTSGMSDRPMNAPDASDRYAELFLSLPGDWPLHQADFAEEANYWPVRWLKALARLPHEYDTWLGWGHTIPNGDPAEPFAESTSFCCWLVLPPLLAPEEFGELEVSDDKRIRFLALVPLYEDEMNYKLEEGAQELVQRFERRGVSELVDVGRLSVMRPAAQG